MRSHSSGRLTEQNGDAVNEVSQQTSRLIFDDAIEAYRNPDHPCHRFVELQVGISPDQWQLPEPFNGRSCNSGLVFLGLNPSFGANEDVPRIGSSFEDWDRFYRARFDGLPPEMYFLYKRYQTLGEYAAGPTFQLGIDAIVLEVVRFKSWNGSGINDPGVLDHERTLLEQLLADISPRVIVCQTNQAGNQLAALSPEFRTPWIKAPTLKALEGTVIPADFAWGRTFVAPSRHFNAARGMSNEDRQRIAEAVRTSLA